MIILSLLLALALQTGSAPAAPADSSAPSTTAAPAATGSKGSNPGPDSKGNYRIGRGVSMPEVIHKAEPVQPKDIGRLRDHDAALIGLTIDAQGLPINVHLVHSVSDATDPKQRTIADAFDQACIEAAKHYRFKPSMFQGKPVPVELDISMGIN